MKKKMFKCIAVMVSLAIVFAQGIATFAEETKEPEWTIDYDATTYTFSVSGSLPVEGRKFVTVVIAPQDTSISSGNELANDDVILKTVRMEPDGSFNFRIVLPDSFTEPRYRYNVSVENLNKTSVFSTIKENSLTSSLAQINNGSQEDVKTFVRSGAAGLDDGKTKDHNFISEYIIVVKPAGGHTEETLFNAYMVGEGLSYVNDGILGIDAFLSDYYHYLDKNYIDDFEKLNANTQIALAEAFDKVDSKKAFSETYSEKLFIAEYRTAENATILKDKLLTYFKLAGISLSDYEAIKNDVYMEKVFDELYKSCNSQKTLEEIVAAFNEEVEIQKDAADKKSESGSNGGSGGGGGGFGGGSKVNIMPTDAMTTTPAAFSDTKTHWAKSYIERMSAEGVVNGFADGTFKPDNYVTRAEFAKMLAMILKLDVTGNADFADVAQDSWYNGYVAAVSKLGIVKGADGNFMPNKQISRQDTAVMLARVLEYKGKTYATDSVGFTDENDIAEYAKDSVNGMASLGMITGDNNMFMPLDSTTRAQAAALLVRVSDYIK